MLSNRLLLNTLNRQFGVSNRLYTVIVERHEKVPIQVKGMDQRKYDLKSRHFHYKLVDCLHTKKWGNVDLVLTEYVEGIGHKGEIVNIPRHTAYYDLLPSRLAVYPTEEYLELYKKDREVLATKAKVSPYAMRTKEELSKIVLDIPMNMNTDWTLTVDNIRIALRYNKIMCRNEDILVPDNLGITSKNYSNFETEPFNVQIKINDYVTADLRCRIKQINESKLWEEFTVFQKTV